MPYTPDRAASRHARDRDLLPVRSRPGPYELRYDVRRGYEQSLRDVVEDAPSAGVLLFRGRDDEPRLDD